MSADIDPNEFTTCSRCKHYDKIRGERMKQEIARLYPDEVLETKYAQALQNYHALHRTAGRVAALFGMIADGEETLDAEHVQTHEDPRQFEDYWFNQRADDAIFAKKQGRI